MIIDWNAFTPFRSLTGGILLGLAAAILLLTAGRIAGISGIAGGLLRPRHGDIVWRAAFLAGLIGAPAAYAALAGWQAAPPAAGTAAIVAAGLLVGLGTRYGSGCTSGHGICGVSRASPRSLAATALFMAAGFVTVYLVRHLFA